MLRRDLSELSLEVGNLGGVALNELPQHELLLGQCDYHTKGQGGDECHLAVGDIF